MQSQVFTQILDSKFPLQHRRVNTCQTGCYVKNVSLWRLDAGLLHRRREALKLWYRTEGSLLWWTVKSLVEMEKEGLRHLHRLNLRYPRKTTTWKCSHQLVRWPNNFKENSPNFCENVYILRWSEENFSYKTATLKLTLKTVFKWEKSLVLL